MLPYKDEKTFQRNLNYLTKVFPKLFGVFDRVKVSTNLIIDKDGDFDIDIGGGKLLYAGGAKGAAERQVKNYLASPIRYHSPLPTAEDRVQWNYVEKNSPLVNFLSMVESKVGRHPESASPLDESIGGGFLFVFGIGLGFHIQYLAEALDFKSLVIIEPHDQLFFHSLHVMDWEIFGKELISDGKEIFFIRGNDLFNQFVTAAHSKQYPFLGGSYLYSHYEMPELTELISEISKRTEFILGAEGWTEDQLQMFHNSSINLSRSGFYLQTSLSNTKRSQPAIVVGAGPSLDKNIHTIKQYQNDVVIISSSSSLSALLANGITPDIHCALENTESLGIVLENLSNNYDFSNITLYASFTVNEKLSACFKRTIYFLRRDIAASYFFSRDGLHTELAEPLTGNTALLCALSFGFKDIYLFGLDFGARTPATHHSRHSVDFTHDKNFSTPFGFESTVPGNFGGVVNNGWLLEFSRIRANAAIENFELVNVRNCSDGAFIPAAPPLDHKSINITQSKISQDAEIIEALKNLKYCEKGLFKPTDLISFNQKCKNFIQKCISIIKEASSKDRPSQKLIKSVSEEILEELNTLMSKEPAVHSIFKGDVQTVLATIHHYTLVRDFNLNDQLCSEIICILETFFVDIETIVDTKIGLIIESFNRKNG